MEPLEPELRRLIADAMPAAAPRPEVEARGLERLLAALPGPGGPDGSDGGGAADPGPIAATSKLAAGLKALLLVGGISGAALGVVALTGDEAPPARREAAPRPPPSPAPEPPVVAPVTPAEPAPVRRPRASAPAVPAEDPLLAETLAVAEADAALGRGEYARARELALAIARTYPEGQLALERAAIELGARCGLQEPGAGAAALEFLRAHADAAVAAKVRARCGDPEKNLSPP